MTNNLNILMIIAALSIVLPADNLQIAPGYLTKKNLFARNSKAVF